MRRLLPLLALLTACVDDLPVRQVQQPPPDRGIPIPPPFRPDAFRGWGGGGDAGELDAGDAFDLGRGPDATELDHQVGDARPRDAGELDAGDGLVGDAGLVDAEVIDVGGTDRAVSDWLAESGSYSPPVCAGDYPQLTTCTADESCLRMASVEICQLPCGGALGCPDRFICCHWSPEWLATIDYQVQPFCIPGSSESGPGQGPWRHLCVTP